MIIYCMVTILWLKPLSAEVHVARPMSGFDNNTELSMPCRKAAIITNVATTADNYKSHHVMTSVYRMVGKSHQGLGCIGQQLPHKEETHRATSLENDRSDLESHRDHRQPPMDLQLPNSELLRPGLRLLLL